MITDPLTAGFLLMLVRSAPYTDIEIKNIKEKSIRKELLVMEATTRPSEYNYRPFFMNVSEAIHRDIPYNKDMSKLVRDRLHSWRSSMNGRILYPRMSSKTLSIDTCRKADDIVGSSGSFQLSQVSIESYYSEYGVKIQGCCEMRQKWYQANTDPRTYYAMGGEAYHKSKYLQSVFNELCETLDPCSKTLSVSPDRLGLLDDEYAYIYDLASFTSNMHEQKHFLHWLGTFCMGVSVYLLDTHVGLVEADFGGLILEYNEVNCKTTYSLERVMTLPPFEAQQQVAGLLGVYGNISTAKFLHGCVMLQLVQSQNKLNVAGDDGIIAVKDNYTVYRAICTMGDMEVSKAYQSYEEGCVCLKRPLTQIGNRLYMGTLLIWASLEYELHNKNIDNRFTTIGDMSKEDRQTATGSSVLNMLKQLSSMVITDKNASMVRGFISFVYESSNLPVEGNIPQITGTQLGFVPSIIGDYLGKDPIEYTIMRLYRGVALLPKRDIVPFQRKMIVDEQVFICNSNKHLSLLEKLGYYTYTKVQEIRVGEDGYLALLREFSEYTPVLNCYTRIKEIPSHLM